MEFTTITPIWTGGVKQEVKGIHESGIIGSMRWWYAAIVRGLGGKVHSPGNPCKLDEKLYKEGLGKPERQRLSNAGLCDVCQVFGATGWRRRFNLVIEDNTTSYAVFNNNKITTTGEERKNKEGRFSMWFLPDKPLNGRFGVKVVPYGDFAPNVIYGLLYFISKYGTLGAKPQMGFGIVESPDVIDLQPFKSWLALRCGGDTSYENQDVPSLKNMFFLLLRVGDNVPNSETFNIRYDLRKKVTTNNKLNNYLFGSIKKHIGIRKGPLSTKVNVSLPFEEQIRIWGWVPEMIHTKKDVVRDREQIVEKIHQELSTTRQIAIWREFNSSRDNFDMIANELGFIESLLASVDQFTPGYIQGGQDEA